MVGKREKRKILWRMTEVKTRWRYDAIARAGGIGNRVRTPEQNSKTAGTRRTDPWGAIVENKKKRRV